MYLDCPNVDLHCDWYLFSGLLVKYIYGFLGYKETASRTLYRGQDYPLNSFFQRFQAAAFRRFEVHMLIGGRVSKWIILIAAITCLIKSAEQNKQFANSVPCVVPSSVEGKRQIFLTWLAGCWSCITENGHNVADFISISVVAGF